MSKPTAEITASGARVTGIKELPGWSVLVDFTSGAVTVIPPVDADGRPVASVDSTIWRKIPLGSVLREADSLRHGDILDAMIGLFARDAGDPSRSSRGGKRAHLQRVARVYRVALDHGVRPADALQHHFEADSARTVQRWITQARQAGLIGTYAQEKDRGARHLADLAKRRAERGDKGNGRTPGKGSTAATKGV